MSRLAHRPHPALRATLPAFGGGGNSRSFEVLRPPPCKQRIGQTLEFGLATNGVAQQARRLNAPCAVILARKPCSKQGRFESVRSSLGRQSRRRDRKLVAQTEW